PERLDEKCLNQKGENEGDEYQHRQFAEEGAMPTAGRAPPPGRVPGRPACPRSGHNRLSSLTQLPPLVPRVALVGGTLVGIAAGGGGVTGTGLVLLACAHYAYLDTLPDEDL